MSGRTRPRSALVLGLGLSGRAAAEMLLAAGARVAVTDDDPATLAAYQGQAAVLGRRQASDRLADYDQVVVSPGVPRSDPLLAKASEAGHEVISELALAARSVEAPLVAITGTNGKSTTVSLLARIFDEEGLNSETAGNIGRPLSCLVGRELDRVVAEVSSFQLEWAADLSPEVACLLNIGSDHLDRHGDLATYRRTKLRIFGGPQPPRLALLPDSAGPDMLEAARESGAELWRFGTGQAAYEGPGVVADPHGPRLCPAGLPALELGGAWPRAAHDLDNAAAAAAVALALGLSARSIERACASFKPLEHRLSLVTRARGLSFWDDSKATNPDATLASVASFDGRVVLLVGGDDKGADLSPLASAAARIKGAVAYGAARERLGEVFGGALDCLSADTLEDAFDRAVEIAEAGDAVLLAPACSSLDQFADYAERGRRFAELAENWAGGAA